MTHDDKVVIFGMSCVGKTTLAQSMTTHEYVCFDALFDWYSIETLGLSISTSLSGISGLLKGRYVLDGWHLADKEGALLPPDCVVYVLYADYERIIGQYRVEVHDPEEYRFMFKRWYYDVPYLSFPRVRFVENTGEFVERTADDFRTFSNNSR